MVGLVEVLQLFIRAQCSIFDMLRYGIESLPNRRISGKAVAVFLSVSAYRITRLVKLWAKKNIRGTAKFELFYIGALRENSRADKTR